MKYSDEDVTVLLDGTPILMLNKDLLEKQGVSPTALRRIKALHVEKLKLYRELQDLQKNGGISKDAGGFYHSDLTAVEWQLQAAWGFSKDINFHRFWESPGCICPQMDNEDRYPYGHYVINQACPLHGT